MGMLVLIKGVMDMLPGGMKNPAWIYVTILISISSLYVDQMESMYVISAQRISLKMPIVTPYEIDALEHFCVHDTNPIKRALFNRKLICRAEVLKFFKDRDTIKKTLLNKGVPPELLR